VVALAWFEGADVTPAVGLAVQARLICVFDCIVAVRFDGTPGEIVFV
jgi:hypothetical protein